MKTLDTMTKDEKSLLLFFETCAVDYGGSVPSKHMNETDFVLVDQWKNEGFIQFGRLNMQSVKASGNRQSTHWVELSDMAWVLAHLERRARHKRMYERRTWQKTSEKAILRELNLKG